MTRTQRRLTLEALEDRTLLSVFTVTRLSDLGIGRSTRGDLRYCITKANETSDTDVIVFSAQGSIQLNSALPDIDADLIIAGPGADKVTVRGQAAGDFRVFTIANVTVEINGITVSSGNGDVGGGILNQGDLKLVNAIVDDNNSRSGVGGGIYNTGDLTMSGSTVSNNTAIGANFGFGGGIFNENGASLSITESVITKNTADRTCSGDDCFNQVAGGGIFNSGSANLIIDLSTVSDNKAQSPELTNTNDTAHGGGIFNASTATITNSTISGNLASVQSLGAHGWGGGIFNAGPSLVIINSTIAGNTATSAGIDAVARGGGIHIEAGTLSVQFSTIASNVASNPTGSAVKEGGGVEVGGGTLELRNTILSKNTLTGTGPKFGPDIHGIVTSLGHNLISSGSASSGYVVTDILDVDPLLGPLADNGGPTFTMALLPGSQAIDAGDNTDVPEFDQRGTGFLRVVNTTIDIGAFEVQATPAPTAPFRSIDAALLSTGLGILLDET